MNLIPCAVERENGRVGLASGGHDFKVEAVELLGVKKILTFIAGEAIVLAVVPAARGIKAGDTVKIAIDARRIYIFDENTKKVLV